MIDTLRSRRRRSDTVPHRVQIQLSTRCLVRDRAGGYPAARTDRSTEDGRQLQRPVFRASFIRQFTER